MCIESTSIFIETNCIETTLYRNKRKAPDLSQDWDRKVRLASENIHE